MKVQDIINLEVVPTEYHLVRELHKDVYISTFIHPDNGKKYVMEYDDGGSSFCELWSNRQLAYSYLNDFLKNNKVKSITKLY